MPPTDNTLHAQLRALVAGPPTDECLLFPGFVAESGYGSLKIDGKTRGAHQVAWELHNQQAVPVGMFVLHSCLKTRSCVNWRHLRIGTAQDNADDRNRDGMTSSGDNHYARTNPERLARGDAHGSRLHPGALPATYLEMYAGYPRSGCGPGGRALLCWFLGPATVRIHVTDT